MINANEGCDDVSEAFTLWQCHADFVNGSLIIIYSLRPRKNNLQDLGDAQSIRTERQALETLILFRLKDKEGKKFQQNLPSFEEETILEKLGLGEKCCSLQEA